MVNSTIFVPKDVGKSLRKNLKNILRLGKKEIILKEDITKKN